MSNATKTPEELRDELVADLSAIRACGVMKFKGSGIDVEFFPVATPEPREPAQPKPIAADVCKCGHETFKHDAIGLCVEGCSEEECRPKEGPK